MGILGGMRSRRAGPAAACLRSERGRKPIGPPKRPGRAKRGNRRARPRFQRLHCNRRRRNQQRNYACRAFREEIMRRLGIACAALLAAGASSTPPPAPRGFFAENAAAQLETERAFRAVPDPAVARESMRRLAEAPHHLGSAQGGKNAEWILAKFREFGLDARIETFEVLFPTPRERVLELVAPTRYRAALGE